MRLFLAILIASFTVIPSCTEIDYSDDIDALKAKNDSLAAALQVTNENLQKTDNALANLGTTVTSIQTQLGVILGQISTLDAQLTQINSTVNGHTGTIALIQEEITQIQSHIKNLHEQQVATNSAINVLSTTVTFIQAQIKSILIQVDSLNSQQAAIDEKLQDIFSQLALSNNQLSTLTLQFKALLTYLGLAIDVEGNIYHTVTIGTQVWMVENLRTTKFRNGDPVAYFTTSSEKGYCWYNDDAGNKYTYGAIYNYYTVIDIRGLCPEGWHVPTLEEWTTLSNYLGGNSVAGGKLKETGTAHWQNPNTGATNESGFTALPSGAKDCSSNFVNMGINAQFWTSAPTVSGGVWAVTIFNDNAQLQIGEGFDCNNYPVRCIKD